MKKSEPKYVGHVFKVNDRKLKIRGNGAHYVHVQWYNPVSKKFRCRVITSLEEEVVLSDDKSILGKVPYEVIDKNNGIYRLFFKRKYRDIRKGLIEPIPISKLSGFDVWSGYHETRFLTRDDLSGKRSHNKKVLK